MPLMPHFSGTCSSSCYVSLGKEERGGGGREENESSLRYLNLMGGKYLER